MKHTCQLWILTASLKVLVFIVMAGNAAAAEPAQPLGTAASSSPGGHGDGNEPPLAATLGVTFVSGSTSTVMVEKDGKKYLVELVSRTVREIDTPADVPAALQESSQASQKPESSQAPSGAPSAPKPGVYEPGDDNVFSLPTGRRVDRHGFYVNFSHRFPFQPSFSGKTLGGTLLGLDNFALPSFGFRYGVTEKLSVSIFRSPTLLARPIELGVAYNFADERDGAPVNAAVRFSVDGQDTFSKNHTENFEGIFSRSITARAQLYLVPTVSLNDRRLVMPPFPSPIPDLPGYNAFSLGIGGSVDIRPTVALVAEVIPTLSGGRALGIHRPAYSFGIQKKLWRHAFTLGFSNSPGVLVSQRAGTRATYLRDPSADTPGGLTIGFDLTRQIY